jgi:endonuclease G, mitochondrial
MLIKRTLIAAAAAKLRQTKLNPDRLNKELGDGPLQMTVEQKKQRYRQLLADTGDAQTAELTLERIIQGNDLDSINYLAKGAAAARPICRLQLKDTSGNLIGYASGFLIGPGLLMTNHHVFGQASEAKNSICDFDYELDVDGNERMAVHFGLEPSRFFYTNIALDYSLVAVAAQSIGGGKTLSDWGWLLLDATPGKADLGEYLTIIQHPAGQMKQVCVRENKLIQYQDTTVWYATDTLGGSSGSPVFNRFWQVVALHHSGVPRTNAKGQWLTKDGQVWDESMDETLVDWMANEGIRTSSLVADLKANLANQPLVKAALESAAAAPVPPVEDARNRSASTTKRHGDFWVEQNGDRTTLVVPLRLPVEMVSIPLQVSPLPPPAPVTVQPVSPPVVIEKVVIAPGIASRPGYQPDFLGKGNLLAPLPKIPASLKSKIATLVGHPSQSELKYFNYSVVMNKERKLAFFSAVNVDASQQNLELGKREGDTWFRDNRLADEVQIGPEFYGKQATLEADRTKNPFDRGHLVRRLDATWGKNVTEATKHGNDSFHFTNCSPQFWKFNQGPNLWAGLEDYVRNTLLDGQSRGVVMNGPVFDGPEAAEGELPRASDPSRKDPTFGGVAIPKYFWKLFVTVENGGLSAAAFLMSQQDQILGIDRIQEALTAEQARVFQISMPDLAKFSKLDFGKLAHADTHEAAAGPREILSFADIRLV